MQMGVEMETRLMSAQLPHPSKEMVHLSGSPADAQNVCRFRDNPLVSGDPRIRFYAGAPLIIHDNVRIGSL